MPNSFSFIETKFLSKPAATVWLLIFIFSFSSLPDANAGKKKSARASNFKIERPCSVDDGDIKDNTESSSGTDVTEIFEDCVHPLINPRKIAFETKKKEYLESNINIRKVARTVGLDICSTIATAGVGALSSSCAISYLNLSQSQQANYITTALVAGSVSQGISNIISAIRNCRLTPIEGLTLLHKDLKKASADLVRTLPADVQEKIELLDSRINQVLSNNGTETALRLLKRREEVFLSFPTAAINLSHEDRGGNPDRRKKIEESVGRLVGSYPEDIRESLTTFIRAIRDNSVLPDPIRAQAYLYGPPATGKTTFVRRLGKALGVPVCEIKLSDLSVQELLGLDSLDDFTREEDDKAIGKLAQCFLNSGYNNPIVLFDEAEDLVAGDEGVSEASGPQMAPVMGRAMGPRIGFQRQPGRLSIGHARKLLDPSNTHIYLGALGIWLDTRRATYIYNGNRPVTDEATLTRLPQMVFKRLPVATKKRALSIQLNRQISALKEVYGDRVISPIERMARSYADFILQEDENLGNPGARILNSVVVDFINHLRNLNQENRLASDEQLKSFVRKSIMQRKQLLEEKSSRRTSP